MRATRGFAELGGRDAYAVLGLAPSATELEIRRAHRGRMRAVHPDAGGSAEQATLVNLALEVLLHQRAEYDRHRRDTLREAGTTPGAARDGDAAGDVRDDVADADGEDDGEPWEDPWQDTAAGFRGGGDGGDERDVPGPTADRWWRPTPSADDPLGGRTVVPRPVIFLAVAVVAVLIGVMVGAGDDSPAPVVGCSVGGTSSSLPPCFTPTPLRTFPPVIPTNLFPTFTPPLPSVPLPTFTLPPDLLDDLVRSSP